MDLNKYFIDGRWVDALGDTRLSLIDPNTEETYGKVALGSDADVDAAVASARRAFPAWSLLDARFRIACVERMLEIYLSRIDEMAKAISREMGAPIDLARQAQAALGQRHMTNYLAAMKDFEFIRPLGLHAPNDRIALEPVGVAALITPWNWPIHQIALKVVAALLAGCTMVLKPSEMAPLSATLFAEIIEAAGVPAGVFNLIHGDGLGAGQRLSTHPDVDMVSFTGSTRAGIAISKASADTLKRVGLELGGKGANLIFADADEKAVERGVRQCFVNSGQNCNAPSRMLVERSIYDRSVEIAASIAKSVAVGPSDQHGAQIGPVISAKQFERIQSLMESGIAEGARLVAGGPGRPADLNRGYFVKPTVFADVSNDMTIAREEIFGPVLSIIPFDNEEQAIEIANDTPYGLTNYVQSQDHERRMRVARRLRSGMVEMNGQPRGAGAPFGGIKASGHSREGGRWGIEEYLEVKSISGWSQVQA
ncbi:aldehyde dehydrogenase family protein [Mesorhizobium sp. BAC0120]|uniref:aldehyde dehydrogenase family protein n=1 Tax=Mesorhizobium sp. BAC0120 TaxID=3090670 RepID=UPI00298BF5D9|nr:aldehyde dehydrogenase family protein [Mesorhizobium sp. BAC0120]MDW6022504.1 aldehyde dehydrogenase family protein [Mesorhizobium sp. BAC0120]